MITRACWGALLALTAVVASAAACGKEHAPVVAGTAAASPGVNPSRVLHRDDALCGGCAADTQCNSLGRCVPDAWFCGPMYYAAGATDGCDCDCGVPDPDCNLPGITNYCYEAGRTRQVDACSACSSGGMPEDEAEGPDGSSVGQDPNLPI